MPFSRIFRTPCRAVVGTLVVLGLGGAMALGNPLNGGPVAAFSGSGGDDLNWSEVFEDHAERWSAPTAPHALTGLALPWEPSRAVVVVLPLAQMQEEAGIQRIFDELLAAVLPHSPVVALFHERDQALLGEWLGRVEADPRFAAHLERIELVPSEVFSIWARDFSPAFAWGTDGRLVGIDSSFLATRRLRNLFQAAKVEGDPSQQAEALREASHELRGMRGSDAVPALLTSLLEGRWRTSTALVRAPIYLLGGDFLPVTQDAALVSTLTLAENGGRAAAMEQVFRDYYGLLRVVWLEGLPGDSIEHLDFIAHPIAEKVILVAAPPEFPEADRPYHRWLDRELRGRFARNRAVLAEAFPDHQLIDVPMPPPLLDDRQAVADQLFSQVVQQIADGLGPSPQVEDSAGAHEFNRRLADAIRNRTGLRDANNPLERRRAVENFYGRSFAELEKRHVEAHVHYRSYLNSFYLKTPSGEELVLVPRYEPAHAAESSLLLRLEREVAAAYAQALPTARLVWIDCTELAPFLGALHCLTATIPAD